MNNYIQVLFTNIQPEQAEMLIAQLSEAGFDGFEEREDELRAFIPEKDYDKLLLKELAYKYQLQYSEQAIPEQNWNALWESNFQPVVVDDFVGIRAGFHDTIPGVEHEIVITPKMSFGTGHHATTYMMIQQMRDISFAGKWVFDFGTGTGVLAILAEKLGASSVFAIDNDDWSIENARENCQFNNCALVELKKKDSANAGRRFDIILANINKNVILENMNALAEGLNPGGILLISGLLEADENDILAKAGEAQLLYTKKTSRSGWISLKINK
jgi:ribosomal protein L11 methyltransferase